MFLTGEFIMPQVPSCHELSAPVAVTFCLSFFQRFLCPGHQTLINSQQNKQSKSTSAPFSQPVGVSRPQCTSTHGNVTGCSTSRKRTRNRVGIHFSRRKRVARYRSHSECCGVRDRVCCRRISNKRSFSAVHKFGFFPIQRRAENQILTSDEIAVRIGQKT